MKQLYNLDPAEVSLVPKGANKKKFLIFKSQKGSTEMQLDSKTLETIAKGDPEVMSKVEEILKGYNEVQKAAGQQGMDDKCQTALKAMARIATPFKTEKGMGQVLKDIMSAMGLSQAENGGEPLAGAAGHEHEVGKLGSQMYPAAQIALKADKTKNDDPDNEENDDETEEDGPMATKKSITKADGTLDLDAVPEAVRPAVEAIYKEQQEAVTKAAKLGEELATERKFRVEKEFKEKAEGYKHLGADKAELATVMKSLTEVNPEMGAKLESILKAADEQVRVGKLFESMGSDQSSKGPTTWVEIEKAAEAYVAKSGEKVSQAQAVEKFLASAEGQKMYAQHQSQRPGGI